VGLTGACGARGRDAGPLAAPPHSTARWSFKRGRRNATTHGPYTHTAMSVDSARLAALRIERAPEASPWRGRPWGGQAIGGLLVAAGLVWAISRPGAVAARVATVEGSGTGACGTAVEIVEEVGS
jgi:hypothetical protein